MNGSIADTMTCTIRQSHNKPIGPSNAPLHAPAGSREVVSTGRALGLKYGIVASLRVDGHRRRWHGTPTALPRCDWLRRLEMACA